MFFLRSVAKCFYLAENVLLKDANYVEKYQDLAKTVSDGSIQAILVSFAVFELQ